MGGVVFALFGDAGTLWSMTSWSFCWSIDGNVPFAESDSVVKFAIPELPIVAGFDDGFDDIADILCVVLLVSDVARGGPVS